ncbi:DUF7144 family membrane protein [Pilimelia columellifera]|uniref:DUF7144 domain-containing protein n=1 Tax=Pilimelia columellifera subsp. columellifera TaxID=706583 RepID=A0ABP6AX45_9ACTN
MTTYNTPSRPWVTGGLVLASTMMVILGLWQVFVGIAAIVNDDFFVVGVNYTYKIDTTTWGWIHLALGVAAVVAGVGLSARATWARVLGMVFAGLAMLNNFIFLPYYPLWSMTVIALSVFVIWALANAKSDESESPRM